MRTISSRDTTAKGFFYRNFTDVAATSPDNSEVRITQFMRSSALHSEMAVATAIAYVAHRTYYGFDETTGWLDAGVLALEAIFFLMSRDTLALCGRPHKDKVSCDKMDTAKRRNMADV